MSDDYFPTPKGKVHNFMLCTNLWKEQLLEKQSQSPCEHPKLVEVGVEVSMPLSIGSSLTAPVKVKMWLCDKCGLVTCKNPND